MWDSTDMTELPPIVLRTFSFQARSFYERNGFEEVATIEDHPRGHRNLLMRKRLAAAPHEPGGNT
jgi:hypothetical protein